MGTFIEQIISPNLYNCRKCGLNISSFDYMKTPFFFTSCLTLWEKGRAFLFTTVVNIYFGKANRQAFVSGDTILRSVHCQGCHTQLGQFFQYVAGDIYNVNCSALECSKLVLVSESEPPRYSTQCRFVTEHLAADVINGQLTFDAGKAGVIQASTNDKYPEGGLRTIPPFNNGFPLVDFVISPKRSTRSSFLNPLKTEGDFTFDEYYYLITYLNKTGAPLPGNLFRDHNEPKVKFN